jgi:hypothetical protein
MHLRYASPALVRELHHELSVVRIARVQLPLSLALTQPQELASRRREEERGSRRSGGGGGGWKDEVGGGGGGDYDRRSASPARR